MMPHNQKLDHKFYGSNTVGEKGQITIPAKAREALDIKAGDEIVFFGHGKLLHMINADRLDEMLDLMRRGFEKGEAEIKKVQSVVSKKKGKK